jgi:hypothetical protein
MGIGLELGLQLRKGLGFRDRVGVMVYGLGFRV